MKELGHPQPATIIRTDNQTAKGFVRGTIKQKRSRTFDRQYWWLKDREAQLQFNIVWEPGIYNLADYFTKHHTGKHHLQVRPIYLHCTSSPTSLQGCAKIFDNKEPGKVSSGVTNDSRLTQTGDWDPFMSQKIFTLKGRNQRYLSKECQLSQPHNSPTSASHTSPHNSPYESSHNSPHDSPHDSPYAQQHTIVSNE